MSLFGEKLHEYVDKFKHEEGYFVRDLENIRFFSEYPDNTKMDSVMLKLSAINHHDIEKLSVIRPMADHIVSLNIDPKIQLHDLSVVEDIARLSFHGKTFYLLNFASIYCNYHKPGVFPIFSEQHMDFYRGYNIEHHLNDDVDTFGYVAFKNTLDDMLTRYHLKDQLNYFEARKLGWLYLDKIIAESTG